MSDLLHYEIEARGVSARILAYRAGKYNHRSVQYNWKGVWKNVPYKEYGFATNFGVFKNIKYAKIYRA